MPSGSASFSGRCVSMFISTCGQHFLCTLFQKFIPTPEALCVVGRVLYRRQTLSPAHLTAVAKNFYPVFAGVFITVSLLDVDHTDLPTRSSSRRATRSA